jgi:hypothetical protein
MVTTVAELDSLCEYELGEYEKQIPATIALLKSFLIIV